MIWSISLITPVLDEEDELPAFLKQLAGQEILELILVDGGSRDRTREIASKYSVTCLQGPTGRGSQLNLGARQARGDILFFVHCDTRLPGNFPKLIRGALDSPATSAGAFSLTIDGSGWSYRLIEAGANLRSRLLGLPYGDQGLFLTRRLFKQIGGYPDQPLLEDVALVRRLRRLGKILVLDSPIRVSARRWQRLGPWHTTVLNQTILLAYLLGMSPARLARIYYRRRRAP